MVPADSARVAAAIYGASLLSVAPIALAAVGAMALRQASAATRVLVWRTALLCVLLAFIGRASPAHWTAWVLPSVAAAPLVALGRVQVGAAAGALTSGAAPQAKLLLDAMLAVYVTGMLIVLAPVCVSLARLRALRHRSARGDSTSSAVAGALELARRRIGLRRAVRVYVSREVRVPVTWGWWRPVVVLPATAAEWSHAELELAISHELAHVRNADWLVGLAARATCAVVWFNPGVWWLAHRLGADREIACDQRVLASGAAPSDYADLLIRVAAALDVPGSERDPLPTAFALTARGGLRQRLAIIVAAEQPAPARGRGAAWCSRVAALALLAAVFTLRLAPTRGVLDSLMQDARWQTRAFAVVGLAQRSDSVAVARAAAERDPSPRVRAWARYALRDSVTIE